MTEDICLFITYFLACESALEKYHKQYLKRVDRIREFTDVYFVADEIKGEERPTVRRVLMQDFRRDMQALGQYPFDEEEWDLYSLCCVARDVDEPASEGANVSRLWHDLKLGEERVPRIFTSTVAAINLSADGRSGTLGEYFYA